jgi:type I restriction enzyme, S subunit
LSRCRLDKYYKKKFFRHGKNLPIRNTMDTKALRQKILDLAIHGKLVPQDPNDEPASVLLQRIREEKERLVKEGKIKKGKKAKSSDAAHYENVPFEIPKSWEWCKLGDYVSSVTDGDHQAPPKAATGIPFLVISNLTDGILDFNNTRHVPQTYYDSIQFERKAQKGDILFTVTGSYGIVVKVNTNEPFCFQRHIGLIKPMNDNVCDYLTYILRSKYIKKLCDELATGTAQKTVGLDTLRSFYIPIPPLAEQNRIVSEIERWFSLIDIIESRKENLKSAVQQAKAKILDLAIHGKLVPQNPTDEPASELLRRINPKAEITSDDAQYGKVPQGWCVCDFKCIFSDISSKPYQILQSQIKSKGKHPVVSQSSNFIEGYSDESNFYKINTPIVIFGDHTRNVKFIDFDFIVGADGVKIIKPLCNAKFCYYLVLFASCHIKNKGYSRHFSQISNFKYPLPPLAEQHRIVAKIEQLFVRLDRIEAKL